MFHPPGTHMPHSSVVETTPLALASSQRSNVLHPRPDRLRTSVRQLILLHSTPPGERERCRCCRHSDDVHAPWGALPPCEHALIFHCCARTSPSTSIKSMKLVPTTQTWCS